MLSSEALHEKAEAVVDEIVSSYTTPSMWCHVKVYQSEDFVRFPFAWADGEYELDMRCDVLHAAPMETIVRHLTRKLDEHFLAK